MATRVFYSVSDYLSSLSGHDREGAIAQVSYSQRNIEFVYLKNMPLGLIVRSAPQRFAYEVGTAIYFARQGEGSTFLRAKLDVLRCLPWILRKQTDIQKKKKKTTDSQMLAIMRRLLFSDKWKKLARVGLNPLRGPR